MAKLRTHLAALAKRLAAIESSLHQSADARAEALATYQLAVDGVAAGLCDSDLLIVLRAALNLPRDREADARAARMPR